jgi:hypothetical protein
MNTALIVIIALIALLIVTIIFLLGLITGIRLTHPRNVL